MKKTNPKRTNRGTKGAHNKMLPQELQGVRYRVLSFVVQPEIMLYNADGEEDRTIPAQVNIRILQSNFKKTLPEIMAANDLPMEGGKPK